jgi:hypothetical protein
MAGEFPFLVDSLKLLTIKKKTGESIQVFPWNGIGVINPLISFTINENIFNPLMSGSLIIRDLGDWSNEFNLNGFDELDVKIQGINKSGPLSGEGASSENEEAYTLSFEITSIKNTVSLSNNLFQNGAENAKAITIDFVSKSILNKEFLSSLLEDENFIGPIAGGQEDDIDRFELEGSEPVSLQIQSFNSYLKQKLDIDLDVDRTWNYCYLKKNNVSYPWGKLKGQPTILQTLQYLTENAVNYENNRAANYLFWQDLNGYHFRSVESLIKENKNSDIKTFKFSEQNILSDTIISFDTLSEFDTLDLLNSKTYFSWYDRIIPNYADPYLDFIDTSEALIRKSVVYDFDKEYDSLEHIENGKLFQEGLTYGVDQKYSKLTESQRVDDDIYGFYSKNRYNTPHAQSWDYLGLSADSRLSNVVWQNQFDIDDEVYPEFLYAYDHIIRKNLIKNKEHYVKLKNAKRKWEIYRCSVCCLEQLGGTADQEIIKGLTPSSPDYVYYFGPTGIFTQEQIGSSDTYQIIAGGAFSDVVNYVSGVTKNNGLTLSYDLNSNPYSKSIGEFYNLKLNGLNENIQLIQSAINDYKKEISDTIDVALAELEPFVENADDYAIAALDLAKTTFFPPRKTDCCWGTTDKDECFNSEGEVVDNCADAECPENYECHEDGCTICVRGKIPGTQAELFSPLWEKVYNPITLKTDYTFRPINDGDFFIGSDFLNNRGDRASNTALQESIGDISFNNETYTQEDYRTIGSVPYWIKLTPDYTTTELVYSEAGEGNELIEVNLINNKLCPIDILKEVFEYDFLRGQYNPIAGTYTPVNGQNITSLYTQARASFFNEVNVDLREENWKDLPVVKPPFLYNCSKHKIHDDYYYSSITGDRIGYGNIFTLPDNIKEDIDNGNAFCLYCMNPIYIQYKKYASSILIKQLKIKKTVIQKIIDLLESNLEKYNNLYTEYYNRKAFFISKNPFDKGVTGNILDKKSQLALTSNIKSIQRKPIRGSKYEILANKIGITAGLSGSKGIYEHKIFFNDDSTRIPGISGSHPYYDQKYKKFLNKELQTINYPVNYQLYQSNRDFVQIKLQNQNNKIANLLFGGTTGLYPGQINDRFIELSKNVFLANQSSFIGYDSEYSRGIDETLNSISIEKFNIFNQPLTEEESDKIKPPSIQLEEITSYVRVEFTEPIGLDRLSDFPYGFIRDAGSEYFLPYIVQLTSGPMGRQTIQNNAVVIGMDPYGFDVAVKKNKTKNNYSDYKEWGNYWWKNSFNKDSLYRKTKDISDMSLWSEKSFENEFTYFQNAGSYFYDIGHDFTESDNYSNFIKSRYGIYEDNYYTGDIENPNSRNYEFSKNFSVIKKIPDLFTLNSTKYGGYNLLSSHTHFNIRRSWYDFNFSKNLFLDSNLNTSNSTGYDNLFSEFFAKTFIPSFTQPDSGINPPYETSAVPREQIFSAVVPKTYENITEIANYILSFKGNSNPKNPFAITLQDSEESKQLTSQFNEPSADTFSGLIYNSKAESNDETLKLLVDDSYFKLYPFFGSIFTDAISHYLSADFALYRPGLVTSDVWKYDIFGESEYGIIKPPTLPPEYDNFDSNFAVQFMVFAKQITTAKKGICAQLNLSCLKPDKKPTYSTECPESNPYCQCPAQNLIPKEREPTYKELAIAYENAKECSLIEKTLGQKFLGCILSDPDNIASCNCPEQGEFYPTLLNTIRSNATFYQTPPETPLRRQAQMTLFTGQKAVMTIYPNDSLKIGNLINIEKTNPREEYKNKFDRISGNWMITGINRVFKSTNIELMELTLNRDSVYKENDSNEAVTYKLDIF